MIPALIKQKILEKGMSLDKFGMNDLTWEKEAAKNLIPSLLQDHIGILGGSVYKLDSGRLIQMYDNWSCNFDRKETRQEFCLRSKLQALDYINKYPVFPMFSFVSTIG